MNIRALEFLFFLNFVFINIYLQFILRVIGILEVFGRNDWQLSGMACQILCNYCLGFEGFKVEECGYEPPSNMQNDVVSCESNQVEGEERTCDECSSEALFVSEEIARLKDLLHHYLGDLQTFSFFDESLLLFFFIANF